MARKKPTRKPRKSRQNQILAEVQEGINELRNRPLDPLGQLPKFTPNLHAKKLKIMAEVPVVPCSAISKDQYGLMYAHTQAEKIFQIYADKCREKHLVIRMIDCQISNLKYPDSGREVVKSIDAVLAVCKFEICDTDSGETETFTGAGLGDNLVWSANSAQTVAMKQGLIQYFFTAWPQPSDYCEVVKKELAQLKGDDYLKAIKRMLPERLPEDLTSTQAMKELSEFFGGKE